jgi:hypothetical protein
MKAVFLTLLLLCSNAFANITTAKFSTAQIFDVQWSIGGGQLNASGFNYIFSSINYATQTASAARWTLAQTQDAGANGRYIAFFNSTTNPGTYGMAVYNSNGTVYKLINNTGSFRALADGAIFYNGNGMWGTLITTKQGYNLGQSGSWAVTQDCNASPSACNTALANYTPPSSTPLAAGQTAAPAGPTVVGGTITQTNAPANQTIQSGGSYTNNTNRTSQQTRINTWTNTAAPYSNAVHVDQISGDNNTVTISLTGTKNRVELTLDGAGTNTVSLTQVGSNYLDASVAGYQNSLVTNQTNSIGTNYAETTISGNNNTANHTQGNSQLLFSTVSGNNNTLVTSQTGTGQHYLDVKMTGNGHNVNVNQFGSTANNARIDVTNAGGAATVDLDQGGGKNFTLIQSCGNPAGCSTIVNQQ